MEILDAWENRYFLCTNVISFFRSWILLIMFGQSASPSFQEGRLHPPIAALQFLLLEHLEIFTIVLVDVF